MVLVSITLVLSVVNLFVTFNLQGKIGAGKTANTEVSSGTGEDPSIGSSGAPVTITEFSDFQCPFCGRFAQQTLPSIEENYINTGKARLVFRNFPLNIHNNAEKAAEASECAHEQGMFWQYHDKLFENQNSLSVGDLKKYAKDVGLDTEKFNDCLDSGRMAAEVQKDLNEGENIGVRGTPYFLVGKGSISGACPFSTFDQAIKAELEGKSWTVTDCKLATA